MTINPSIDDLRSSLALACQPQNASLIMQGRTRVLSLPREWVLEHIEQVAHDAIDLTDSWEYRRILELAELLDAALLARFVAVGLDDIDPEVREAAADFSRQCTG